MKKTLAAMSAVLAIALMVPPVWAQSRSRLASEREAEEPEAIAKIINAQGQEIGEAALTETPHGVLIEVELRNYSNRQHVLPGVHAFHFTPSAGATRRSSSSSASTTIRPCDSTGC
jgi:Cu/Zn superoxide dismutase